MCSPGIGFVSHYGGAVPCTVSIRNFTQLLCTAFCVHTLKVREVRVKGPATDVDGAWNLVRMCFLLTLCCPNLEHVHQSLAILLLQAFQQHVAPMQSQVDQVNDQANQFQEKDIVLSHVNVSRLEDLNSRYCVLSKALLLPQDTLSLTGALYQTGQESLKMMTLSNLLEEGRTYSNVSHHIAGGRHYRVP